MSGPIETDPGAVADAAVATSSHTFRADAEEESQIDEELLIEEISIDGMCGVY